MATINIGANSYQAYADQAYADEYLAADVLRAAGWATRSNDEKGKGLVSASRVLAGLAWADGLVPDYDSAAEPIPSVAARLAADLLAKPKLMTDGSGSSNVKVAGAGTARVEFFSPVHNPQPIPSDLWADLFNAGLVSLASESIESLGTPIVTGACDGYRPYTGRYPWDWPIATEDYG